MERKGMERGEGKGGREREVGKEREGMGPDEFWRKSTPL